MTARRARRVSAHGGAGRWTRVVVIALFAALTLLVHHETAAGAAAQAPAFGSSTTSAMPHRGQTPHTGDTTATGMPVAAAMHVSAPEAPTPDGGEGACSIMATQHCSAVGVDTVNLAPPTALRPYYDRGAALGPVIGREVPGTTNRAPPDLSVLSRFLL
ncbi:hypothetical protein [Streptomyces sp. NBC_01092]|uniref:hypothetical protein n=1 Tax=Streptomyces sp. NBC_01092 TaxID=2903748 RepID=UPI0038630DCE|nr:hypothetical protein OG254_04280 [Streptomyces sp. NBC_01092]